MIAVYIFFWVNLSLFLGKEFEWYLSSQLNCFEPEILQINTLTQHRSVDSSHIPSIEFRCTNELGVIQNWVVSDIVEGQTALNPVVDGDYVDVN